VLGDGGEDAAGAWEDAWLPRPVSNLHRVAMIACGARHSVALSDTGGVYAWGCVHVNGISTAFNGIFDDI